MQDDPFDSWIAAHIMEALPHFEIFSTGPLITPDVIIKERETGIYIGLEIKKLIQKSNGSDPRGLTLDYNSCLPCGTTLIKVGSETVIIPCFYLFALISPDSCSIVTLILMDGDFLNYDFNLHKKAKLKNISEYNHGPYGEGSVRHRKMYTYPSPLNYKLKFFHLRQILIAKKHDLEKIKQTDKATELIVRDDIYDNSFHYLILDNNSKHTTYDLENLKVIKDVFKECKSRKEKARAASIPFIKR